MTDEITRPIQNCQFGNPDDGCCLYPDKFTSECHIHDCPFYQDEGFRGVVYLVAVSPDNDIDRCTPLCTFLDKDEAEKYKEACGLYDAMNFHHVFEIAINPKVSLQTPYMLTKPCTPTQTALQGLS